MLKIISVICFAVLVFITNSNSQDRISKQALPEYFPMERFHEINKPKEPCSIKVDENEPLLQKINPHNLQSTSTNQLIDFYEKEERNANDTRRTSSKVQLDNGFLLFERINQHWTGFVWANSFKQSCTYDGNNNKIEELWQPWDGSNWGNYSTNWGDAKKYSYSYDMDNNLVEFIQQNWGWTYWGSTFVNANRQIYTYDGNNNLIEYVQQIGDDSAWVNSDRQISTYDGNRNLIEFIMQTWDGNNWVNTFRQISTYDGNNNKTEYLSQSWYNSAWVNNYKLSYTYDENNNKIEALWQTWDGTSWSNERQDFYTYNINNHLMEHYGRYWEDSSWVIDWIRHLYSYDGNNNLTEYLSQIRNGTSWVNYQREVSTYDGNNNLTGWLSQTRIDTVWINSRQKLYTYDANNNLTEYLEQLRNGSEMKSIAKAFYTYDVSNNIIEEIWQGLDDDYGLTLVNTKKFLYSYIPLTAVNEDLSSVHAYSLSNNYPNPFNPSTKIKYSVAQSSNVLLKIYDVLGKEVATLIDEEKPAGNYDVEFDASNLSSGVYLYKLQAGNFVETKKMILLK